MKNILITGGTGTLGREIIRQLTGKEYRIHVLSSKEDPELPEEVIICTGDLTNPESLKNAVPDVEIIVHCASNSTIPQQVDIEGTRNLLSVVDREKLKHFLYISIVGVDKSDFPYYQAKYEVEKMIAASGLPFTILRATQFHDFVLHRLIPIFDNGESETFGLPENIRLQPIDITEVANKTIELIKERPENETISIGGPEVLTAEELVQSFLNKMGRKDRIEPVSINMFNVFKTGINLCPNKAYGQITWEEFLNAG